MKTITEFKQSWFLSAVAVLAVCSLSACKKNAPSTSYKTDFLSYSVELGSTTYLYKDDRKISISIGDEVDPRHLNSYFQVSPGAVAKINGVVQKSADLVDLSSPVVYSVEAPDGSTSSWVVRLQPNTEESGLGLAVTAKKSNNRNFNWFVSQEGTGKYALSNGGGAAMAMAAKWSDPTLVFINPADVRTELDSLRIVWYRAHPFPGGGDPPPGGSYTPSDITYYLTRYNVPWKIVSLPNRYTSIKNYLDNGYILILCLDLRQIPYDFYETHHIQRFVETPQSGGHFIVVKGYKETDNANYWLEVYDPYTKNLYYSNGGDLKGKDRYYHSASVEDATNKWWDYAIVVGPRGTVMPANLENIVTLPSSILNPTGF